MWLRGRWVAMPALDELDGGGGGDGAAAAAEPAGDAGGDAHTSPAGISAAAYREMALKANPNVVAELVVGETAEEINASLEIAGAAYQRIASTVAEATPAAVAAVSAGGGVRTPAVDMAALSPEAKIALGVRQRNSAA